MNYIKLMQPGGVSSFLPDFALDQSKQDIDPTFQKSVNQLREIGKQKVEEKEKAQQEEKRKTQEIYYGSNPLTNKYEHVYNPGAGFLSAADPVGEFVVGNALLDTPIKVLGKGLLWGGAKLGNNWARAKIFKNAFDKEINNGLRIPLNTSSSPDYFLPGEKSKLLKLVSGNESAIDQDMLDYMLDHGFQLSSELPVEGQRIPWVNSILNDSGTAEKWLIGSDYFEHPDVKNYMSYLEKLFQKRNPKLTFSPTEKSGLVRPMIPYDKQNSFWGGISIDDILAPGGKSQFVNIHSSMDPISVAVHENSHNIERFIDNMPAGSWDKYDWYRMFRPSIKSRPLNSYGQMQHYTTPEGYKYRTWVGAEGRDIRRPTLGIGPDDEIMNEPAAFTYNFQNYKSINPHEMRATMNETREATMRYLRSHPSETTAKDVIKFPQTGQEYDTNLMLYRLSETNAYGSDFANYVFNLRAAIEQAIKQGDKRKAAILKDALNRTMTDFKGSYTYPILAAPLIGNGLNKINEE